jgi:hypothetical protein
LIYEQGIAIDPPLFTLVSFVVVVCACAPWLRRGLCVNVGRFSFPSFFFFFFFVIIINVFSLYMYSHPLFYFSCLFYSCPIYYYFQEENKEKLSFSSSSSSSFFILFYCLVLFSLLQIGAGRASLTDQSSRIDPRQTTKPPSVALAGGVVVVRFGSCSFGSCSSSLVRHHPDQGHDDTQKLLEPISLVASSPAYIRYFSFVRPFADLQSDVSNTQSSSTGGKEEKKERDEGRGVKRGGTPPSFVIVVVPPAAPSIPVNIITRRRRNNRQSQSSPFLSIFRISGNNTCRLGAPLPIIRPSILPPYDRSAFLSPVRRFICWMQQQRTELHTCLSLSLSLCPVELRVDNHRH